MRRLIGLGLAIGILALAVPGGRRGAGAKPLAIPPIATRTRLVESACDYRSGRGCPAARSGCRYGPAGEQDHACTPGALNPAVRQGTISATICRRGYTATVRPDLGYSEELKRRLMRAYGVGSRSPSGFELDHLISLELGGAPADVRNIFPQSHATSFRKDALENELNLAVCGGRMRLREAQRRIVNWAASAR